MLRKINLKKFPKGLCNKTFKFLLFFRLKYGQFLVYIFFIYNIYTIKEIEDSMDSNLLRMLGLNQKAANNIKESESMCSSYAPDFDDEEEDTRNIQNYGNEDVSIMDFSSFEDDITMSYKEEAPDGVDYNI